MARATGKGALKALAGKPVHPFPARMAPDLVLGAVAECDDSACVLDPMSGSGTVPAVARAMGLRAIGMDLDPLAVLITKVRLTPIDPAALQAEAENVLAVAHRRRELRAGEAFPEGCDEETRRFVKFWFDHRARSRLCLLSSSIGSVGDDNIRNALWCAFSRLIITKESGASRARDLAHSRPHRAFDRAPLEPLSKFMSAVKRVADNCIDASSEHHGPAARVRLGDARSMPVKDGSVDLVLTSPPYLNAIDYMRCSKFSLVWMGHSVGEIRRIRSMAVGTEVGMYENDDGVMRVVSALNLRPRLSSRDGAILARYIHDMRRIVGETARVMAAGGRAMYVIGENTVRGTFIRNSRILEMIASDAGLQTVSRSSRRLPARRRYLPPPSARDTALDCRLRREAVLMLEKA